MKLTNDQLRWIKQWLEHRGRPYPVYRMIMAQWIGYSMMIAAIGGLATYFWWSGATTYSVGLGCYLVGVLFRDALTLRVRSRFWPVINEITDWKRAEGLVQDNERKAT